MPKINPAPGAAIFANPEHLLCAYCGENLKFDKRPAQAVGFTMSAQVWCGNEKCPGYNLVGDVTVTTLPGSRHRGRP